MSNFNAVLSRNTENAPNGDGHFSQTVAFSHYNNFSAQLPVDPKTNKLVSGGIKEQATQCFKNIEAVTHSIGHVMNDIVRVTIFVKNIKDVEVVNEVYKSYYNTYLPTRTVVAVNDLPLGALVQVEALLTNGECTIPNAPQSGDLIKLYNNTYKAPICDLSTQVVAFSHYSNVSAQLPIDHKTGRFVTGGIKMQTSQCLKNVKAILEGIDVPLDDIVKVNVYLKDIKDIEAVNEVYTTFFPDSAIARAVAYFPARTTVEVADLPMGARVSVEAVVSHGDGTPPQEVEDRHGIIIEANNTDKAPALPFATQTVAFSHYNHISAQLPVDVKSGKVVGSNVKEQTKQCLNHIKAIVESIDHKLEDVVKVNIFLKNLGDLDAVNEVYGEFFPNGIPARRVVGVANIEKDALVQIDCVVGNEEGTPPII
ncbi:MAG: RidA family protein [Lachnospirales bacterium]